MIDAFILYVLHFNEEILIPLRLLLTALHLTAQITMLLTLEENILAAYPIRGASNPDFPGVVEMTTFVVALGFIALAVSMTGFVLGFSFSNTPLNFFSCVTNVAAIWSMFVIWKNRIHSARIYKY